jgi:phage baseplate assembly protein W
MIREQQYINPIDFELSTALGIDLPTNGPAGATFKLNYLSIDQAFANAKNLLFTNKGERVMQPNFGCDLQNMVFEQVNEDIIELVESNIKTAFSYWLPYIYINKLEVEPYEDKNRINILFIMSLQGNKIDTRSIQFDVLNTQ